MARGRGQRIETRLLVFYYFTFVKFVQASIVHSLPGITPKVT